MIEAQRAMEKISAMFDSASVARVFKEYERQHSWLVSNESAISRYIESIGSMAPQIQKQIDVLNSVSNSVALAELNLSLADSKIQATLSAFENVLRLVPPDFMSKMQLYTDQNQEFRSIAFSIRQMSGLDVKAALERAISQASPRTLEELDEIAQSDALPEIAAALDDVAAQLLNEKKVAPERKRPELTATQQIWLALVMIVLIWSLTMGEQDHQLGEEMHDISQSIIASAILWAVMRAAGERE